VEDISTDKHIHKTKFVTIQKFRPRRRLWQWKYSMKLRKQERKREW
jgi:hypothetical protein